MSRREKYLSVACIVLLLLVITLGVRYYNARIALNFFLRVRPGISEQQVVDIVGKPEWIFKKGETVKFPGLNTGLWELPKMPVENKVYIYIPQPTFLFAVYFDEHDKVTCVVFDAT